MTKLALPLIFAAALLGSASCAALAAPGSGEFPSKRGRDRLDVEYAAEIAAHTTDPQFLTEWVDHLPVSRKVPTPKQFLGYSIGTPGQLTQPDRINAYFRELAATSKHVEVFSMGTSDGGREMIVAAIGSKRNLARLAEIKARNHELADPRVTDEARARAIAKDTPPIYWLTAGLHSPETGSPEMVMELAYRLAVSEQDHIREIRDEVVVLISPVLEMDGRARVVDWFYRHLTKVTDLENSPPRSPPFWGDYTYHDNNRDGLQQTQRLTRNYTETFHEYLPVLTLDLHESVPLLYVSTGTGPYNEAIDPITVTQWQWIASYEVATATKLGLQGVWTWGFYDGWYPGYMLWVANNHNATGRFYETFGNSNPNTFERELDDHEYAGTRVNTREWYRAWPPDKTVKWSLRNNTNYMQTAALASLQLAARHGEELLFDFWLKGRNGIAAGETERPHAFVIPRRGQRDDAALHRLLELLRQHRIEVDEAPGELELRGVAGPVSVHEGDFVVRMDQPHRNFAKTLLLAQSFPKTAKQTPYDDVAWSLDLMLGVEVRAIDDPAILASERRPLTELPALAFEVEPGDRWIVDHRGQAGLASLRWALPEATIVALREPWQEHPAGSLIVSGVGRDRLAEVVAPLHLHPHALSEDPSVPTLAVDPPRVAVFHCWNYTQDSGWLRFSFEQLGIPFTLIDKDELRAGDLHERFDVIVVPSLGGLDFKDMVHEFDTRWSPLAYTQTPEFPSHGTIDSSEDITGGMGFVGLANLQSFVEQGGVLIALGSGGVLAAEGGIAREVETSRPGGTPGSHVTSKVLRPEHPIAWGYPTIDWLFRGNLPIYTVDENDWGHTIVQFGSKTWADVEREADQKADVALAREPLKEPARPDEGEPAEPTPAPASAPSKPLVRSGVVEKPEGIDHRPALLDVPVGQGHVVLFSWNPMHRHQNEHDFAFVTNALLFFDDYPAVPSDETMRAREQP
ncbi:M14 family zinc carboxypeptidase [Nannocystaceae bacterium ST9]